MHLSLSQGEISKEKKYPSSNVPGKCSAQIRFQRKNLLMANLCFDSLNGHECTGAISIINSHCRAHPCRANAPQISAEKNAQCLFRDSNPELWRCQICGLGSSINLCWELSTQLQFMSAMKIARETNAHIFVEAICFESVFPSSSPPTC